MRKHAAPAPKRYLPVLLAWALPACLAAQTVLPYVDYWDSTRTRKRSEGLMVNGREWNEWRFWDPDGHLKEVADFKAGERDGHVVIYFDNDSVRHDGWIRRGRQDSLMRSYYRNGRLMESGFWVMNRPVLMEKSGRPLAG